MARALIHRPRVLLLDEPASGLDPRSRVELRDILRRLAADGVAVLVSSHILSELDEIADRVVLVASGTTMAEQTMAELGRQEHVGYRVRATDPDALAAALTTLGVGTGDDPDERRTPVQAEPWVTLPPMSEDEAADVLANLVGAGVRVVAYEPSHSRLESAYLAMTEDRR